MALQQYVLETSSLVLLLAITIPWTSASPLHDFTSPKSRVEPPLQARQSSSTDVCMRWSQQSMHSQRNPSVTVINLRSTGALVNGTLYLYGGRATHDPQQTTDTWNNDFVTIDLTTTWQITSPSMSALTQPSGPPAVANGYLWSSSQSLYLYGGEFSDSPATSPVPFALWEYDIASASWNEHQNPQTSSGDNAPDDGVAVQRVAEGAGFSVAALGRGFYFGGHQDGYTTVAWPQWIERVYIKSLLEFTFPGFPNDAVQSLPGQQTAGSDGAWRNVTNGALQASDGFPERADGVLAYVPGFGEDGILVGLAGGTNNTLTQLNIIDVYDIASSTWYRQATNGPSPQVRVNPCVVVAAAADGSSYNLYMYGGQNLIANDSTAETQYSDTYILSMPSFTWISVDTSSQSVPPGRAGHTCNVWDGQLISIGGYVGQNISCDSGIYVFDLSSLQWVNQFTSTSNISDNPQSQQTSQQNNDTALPGSYGYQVPPLLQSIIGGNGSGGATLTTPVATATAGPLASGAAPLYPINGGSNGNSSPTSTSSPGGSGNDNNSTTTTDNNNSSSSSSSSNHNVGAIVAGVVAGILFLAACYLGFCAWLYRKRLHAYKHHLDVAHSLVGGEQEQARRTQHEKGAFAWSAGARPNRNKKSRIGRSPMRRLSPGPDTALNARASTDDLLQGQEPSFVGIMLHPRTSLRVVNG